MDTSGRTVVSSDFISIPRVVPTIRPPSGIASNTYPVAVGIFGICFYGPLLSDVAKIKEFHLETRPYQVVEFRNIQVKPRAASMKTVAPASVKAWQEREQKSLSKMRRIDLSLVQYAQDHDGSLPPMDNIVLLRRELGPYLKFQDRVVDQASGQPFGGQAGDAFLSPLSGETYRFASVLSSTATIRQPASTVLLSDTPTVMPDGEKGTRWLMEAFADGHVEGRAV